MAKAKNKLIGGKIAHLDPKITVSIYDNGFLTELTGQNSKGDWVSANIMSSTAEEVVALFTAAIDHPRVQ